MAWWSLLWLESDGTHASSVSSVRDGAKMSQEVGSCHTRCVPRIIACSKGEVWRLHINFRKKRGVASVEFLFLYEKGYVKN